MNWLFNEIFAPDAQFAERAALRQAQLTKPSGSLGVLEELAIRLAAMQRTEFPILERVWISIFASDHGIATESVSAFPQTVTVEMVKNFANGGAAINALARYLNADFEVVDVGLLEDVYLKNVRIDKSTFGTANFLQQQAMTESQLSHALNAGKSALNRAFVKQPQLFIGGEMGIANTTSATAIACALLQKTPQTLTGAGTGLTATGILHKTQIIETALHYHHNKLDNPLSTLQTLGGFEIAALVGAYLYAAQLQIPSLIDGFIATVASLVAIKINPAAKPWFIYAHRSQERGHQLLLETLQVKPLLDLSMRLGEGSGAATAVPLLQMACNLHNKMATFAQAHITTT